MAVLRLCLSLGAASLLASEVAATNDEQSLVQRNVNFHTSETDAARGILDVVNDLDLDDSTHAFMSSAIAALEQVDPTLALFQNASAEQLAKFGAAFVLTFQDEAWVRTLYGGLTKFSNLHSAFSTAVTDAAAELSTNADGANVTLTQSLLNVNLQKVSHAFAVWAADHFGLVKHLLASLPAGELNNMTKGYQEYIKNVTVMDEFKFVHAKLVNKTHRTFESMDSLCNKMIGYIAGSSVIAEGLRGGLPGFCAKAKDTILGAAPAIYAFAPNVTFKFLVSANKTIDTLNSSFYEVALALDAEVKALTPAVMKNLGCTAPSTA